MKKLDVGVDFDDVLMDFNGALCLFHNSRYGTTLSRSDIKSYFLEKTWGCSREEAVKRVSDFYWSVEHDTALPVTRAVEVLQSLQESVSFTIVTSRPESVSTQTLNWLNKYFSGLFEEVRFTSHFFHEEGLMTKGEVCREIGIKFFIDDAPFHIDDVASEVETALLFDTPWNQEHNSTFPNVSRVQSWSEILTVLKN